MGIMTRIRDEKLMILLMFIVDEFCNAVWLALSSGFKL